MFIIATLHSPELEKVTMKTEHILVKYMTVVKKNLNLSQGPRTFTLPCIL